MKRTTALLFFVACWAGLLAGTADRADAFGSYGTTVNNYCGRTVYTSDCGLCHTSNRGDPTPAKTAYSSGNLAYFCPPVVAPPQANAGPGQTVAEGTPVTLDGSNSTGAISSYSWRQTAGPAVTLANATSARASFTAPAVGPSGAALTFQLTVQNSAGASSSATVIVNVTDRNQPPVANAGPPQTVASGAAVTLDGSNSSDPDGTIASYRWSQTAGPAVTLASPTAARTSFVAPLVATQGAALTFQLTVQDNGGLSASASVTVNVTYQNRPPVANAGPTQTVASGAAVTLDGSNSSDPDGTIASYRWAQTAGPAVTLASPTAARTTFAAPAVGTQGAALSFQLTVQDNGGLTATSTVTINVTYQNRPPVANAGPAQTVASGAAVTLDGSNSSDPDGTIASYRWAQTAGPALTLASPTAARTTFAAPFVGAQGASLTFQLTVQDNGGLSSSATVTVNVSQQNQPPIANAGPSQTVSAGAPVFLDGSSSADPDGTVVSYLWRQTSGPSVVLSTPNSATATFTAPASGSLQFELTVEDDAGLTATATLLVNVAAAALPPTADAGPDQTARPQATVTLSGVNSTGAATYQWAQIGGAPVTLTAPGAARTSFIAPATPGALTFELTVTGAGGLAATDTVLVNVVEPPAQPPVANAGPNQTVLQGATVQLDGSGSAGALVSYQWKQVSGPNVVLRGATTAQPTFIAPSVERRGTSLRFQLTVTDAAGLRSGDSVIVNVSRRGKAPHARAGDDRDTREGNDDELDGSGSSDSEGRVEKYRWKQLRGPAVTLSDPDAARASFHVPSGGSAGTVLEFELTVTNDEGLEETDTVSYRVASTSAAAAPAANSPSGGGGGCFVSSVTGSSPEPLGLLLGFASLVALGWRRGK
jgi:hypothetical protein